MGPGEEQQMAKKIPTDGAAGSLGHNPFGALQGLRAALPDNPPPPSAAAPPSSPPTKEFAEKVVVRHERKGHGGKTVTIVTGVVAAARADVADALKRGLGCGARVDGDDIVLQGDLVERVSALLVARGARRVVRGS
jgi:translation initiation factor 1 (eIF-1/SUI1)